MKSDGGPAFPATRAEEIPIAKSEGLTDWANVTYPGMSLRDWFAGQALAGWLASLSPDCGVKPTCCARSAYELADAMLAARREDA